MITTMPNNRGLLWLGARPEKQGVGFRVWALAVEQLEVVIVEALSQAEIRPGELDKKVKEVASYRLNKDEDGYFSGWVEELQAGALYLYRLDGDKLRPDPASRYQPLGVHGPSQVIAAGDSFGWHDQAWSGLPLEETIIYEVHIGTATPEGTFEAFIPRLDYLKSLGVTAIELMPVNDFPGKHNWGYDGVCLFAAARAYGGPEGLRELIDAAHSRGLAIIQDVVYNHLGPDGNYLRDFSPSYFTDEKKTPWGDALNFELTPVRQFFVANALYWTHEFHLDGLRFDATHTILDQDNLPDHPHFLKELVATVRASLPGGRNFVMFAEDERNEVNLVQSVEEGGVGLDGIWADDFHHQLRSALAGDNEGYYADFTGSPIDLAQTLAQGWFYIGQLSQFSGQPRGTHTHQIDPAHFVYCIQNHDQIGNRPIGDRLHDNIETEAYRAASALLLLSPATPLLFQGQEWAASTPFLFFTDHNPDLGKLVTEGRRAEFAHFSGFGGPDIPDPQADSTFDRSKLNWAELEEPGHAQILTLYRDLLQLRRDVKHFTSRQGSRGFFHSATVDRDAIALRYGNAESEATLGNPVALDQELLVITNLQGNLKLALTESNLTRPPQGYIWQLLLSTDDPRYGGNQPEHDNLQTAIGQGQIEASGPITLVLRAVQKPI